MSKKQFLNQKQIDFLRENVYNYTWDTICHILGKSKPVLVRICKEYGIKYIKDTRFKKGKTPNALKVGTIRVATKGPGRKFKIIKDENNAWVSLSHYNWEKVNGPIPEGYKISFIDKNPLNCDISNLKCVSNSELMEIARKNVNYENVGKKMKEKWNVDRIRLSYGLRQKTKLRFAKSKADKNIQAITGPPPGHY